MTVQLSRSAGRQEELGTQVPADGEGASRHLSNESPAYHKRVCLGLSDLKINEIRLPSPCTLSQNAALFTPLFITMGGVKMNDVEVVIGEVLQSTFVCYC